jgi:hypothetical protein
MQGRGVAELERAVLLPGGIAGCAWPRVRAAVFLALLVLYVALALCLSNSPLQDLPDHLTRAHIIADLLFDHGRNFGGLFALKLSFSPYVAGDLALASLDRCVGTAWAARIWVAASIALLPLSVWFVIRQLGASSVSAITAAVLALYLATDRFFILGFTNYLFSVACALFAYGWFRAAVRTGKPAALVCFVALLLLSYAMHLSALAFVIVMTAISSAFLLANDRASARRVAVLMSAPLLLLLLQLWLAPGTDLLAQLRHAESMHGELGALASYWGEPAVGKIAGFAFPALRFDRTADVVLFAWLIATAALPLLFTWPRGIRVSAEFLLVAAAMASLYVVTPAEVTTPGDPISYVDVRALQYALVFLIIAGLRCLDLRPRLPGAQFTLAALLALANLLYVASYLLPENASVGRYKALLASVPAGARVLPIETVRLHYYRPFLHAGTYATLISHAVTPYVFAADRNRHMSYFQYRERPPYAPSEFWYTTGKHPSWDQVARDYRYLLVTAPWNAQMIPVPYTVVARNDTAALLRLEDRQARSATSN